LARELEAFVAENQKDFCGLEQEIQDIWGLGMESEYGVVI
jgi:hypothetical protein